MSEWRQARLFHPNTFPTYSTAEYVVDVVVHGLGVALGIVGAVFLLAYGFSSGGLDVGISLAVYAVGLVAMLVCSALYNIMPKSTLKGVFRRLDHAAIFLLIAGTYTPFAVVKMADASGPWLLAVVWAVALAGIAIKLGRPRWADRISIVLYLVLGWSILFVAGDFISAVSETAAILMLAGGAIYSLGVVFHLWERLKFHNAIWHVLVLAGAGCHYAAVMISIALGHGPA